MTGKEKLINVLTNKYHVLKYSVCPSDFGMEENCADLPCEQCWQQALEKEYPEVEA